MSARQREEQQRQGIFLCYRREDSRWQAGRLADALASRFGDRAVFMDVDRLRIGNWRKQTDHSLADCAAVIIVIGPQWLPALEQRSASDDQVRYEIAQALRLDKIIIPVAVDRARLPHSGDLPEDIAALYDAQGYELGVDVMWRPTVAKLLDDLSDLLRDRSTTQQFSQTPAESRPENVVTVAEVKPARHVTGATAATQLDRENPWPGLDSFEEDARAFFHGRNHEAASLLDRVLDAPVTVLYGRSALGKTSLLQAGLFPLLRDRHFLPVYVRFDLAPGAAPLTRQLHQSVHDSIRAEVPDAMLPSDEESLWEYLHRADFELRSARNYPLTPVIVLDQFEELFTLGERVPDLVQVFKNDLGGLAENRIPAYLAAQIEDDEAVAARFHLRTRNYKLLISLREDFLAELLEEWRELISALGGSSMRLHCLRADDALDAVHKPAGHLMTDALARRVVDIIAAVPSSDVEPALLSLFCRELNEERKRRGQSHFDEQLVEDAKRDTLSNYYSSSVGDLPPRVTRFIETELITEKGFRDSFVREDAVPSRLTEDELARLIGSRLLRVEDRYGAQRIELTSDVLTRVVREHRERRRADEERAALVARAEQERQAPE